MKEYIDMTYQEYVSYLLEKYGAAEHDYFCTTACRSKNKKISRSDEGLFCHHILENKMILLSTPEIARTQPFEYQKAQNLVYADYIEHLLLHVKIVMEDKEKCGLGLGGVIMLSGQLNDIFSNPRKTATGWRKNAIDVVVHRYDEYIEVMRHWHTHVESDPALKNILPEPALAQGWYGMVNRRVYKDIYGKPYQKMAILDMDKLKNDITLAFAGNDMNID